MKGQTIGLFVLFLMVVAASVTYLHQHNVHMMTVSVGERHCHACMNVQHRQTCTCGVQGSWRAHGGCSNSVTSFPVATDRYAASASALGNDSWPRCRIHVDDRQKEVPGGGHQLRGGVRGQCRAPMHARERLHGTRPMFGGLSPRTAADGAVMHARRPLVVFWQAARALNARRLGGPAGCVCALEAAAGMTSPRRADLWTLLS